MEVRKAEDPRVNFEKRFAHYEIHMWTLCHSYLYEKQTSRIQSLIETIKCQYLQWIQLKNANHIYK